MRLGGISDRRRGGKREAPEKSIYTWDVKTVRCALMPFIQGQRTARTVRPPRDASPAITEASHMKIRRRRSTCRHCNPATGRLNSGLARRARPTQFTDWIDRYPVSMSKTTRDAITSLVVLATPTLWCFQMSPIVKPHGRLCTSWGLFVPPRFESDMQWCRQDLLRGGAKPEITSLGTDSQTSGPGAAAARWLSFVTTAVLIKELWIVDICTS